MIFLALIFFIALIIANIILIVIWLSDGGSKDWKDLLLVIFAAISIFLSWKILAEIVTMV